MDSKELTKEERIKKKLRGIKRLYHDLPDNKKKLTEDLMYNAAFMAVTLEDLQAEINESGCVEEYKNGENQTGMKQSAAMQSYNATVRNYTAAIDRLDKMLPLQHKKSKLDELLKDG